MLISLMGPCLKENCSGSIEFTVDDQLGEASTEDSLFAATKKVAAERGGWLCARCGSWTAEAKPLLDAIKATFASRAASR